MRDQAPDFTDGYPRRGERLGPGWQAVWSAMTPGEWLGTRDVASAAEPWIVDKTVSNLLRQAWKRGHLQSRLVKDPLRRRVYRRPVR